MQIRAARRISGRIDVPGDKSISHRAVMIASIADGQTGVENFGSSADCASTIECFRSLGVRIERSESRVTVHGKGLSGLSRSARPLDCGNSGTTMRLISGILAGQQFESVLVGDESLSKRPMKRIIEPLEQMGAVIDSVEGHAPLTVRGKFPLASIDFEPPVASAQLKSCVLLAGLFADGVTSVTERTPTRDHTERMLKGYGADIRTEPSENGIKISVAGKPHLTGRDLKVPGDISSAAFFMVAAACIEGSEVEMPSVGINPTRNAIIATLQDLGASIDVKNLREACGEPIGDIVVRGGLAPRRSSDAISGAVIANLIDEIPVLAVFGTQIEGGLEIRGAGELRVKESDRIAAVAGNLRKMGAEVEEFEDGLRVGKSRLHGAEIETFHDHRIAMAFAVAGLFAEDETKILDAEIADVSFPGFFDVIARTAQI